MNSVALQELLIQLQAGRLSVEAVMQRLQGQAEPMLAVTGNAHIDLDRRRRCGFPEVVFGEGKTSEEIVEIFEILSNHGEDCFGTRVSPEQAEVIRQRFPNAVYSPPARTIRLACSDEYATIGSVAVITAGTSDRPVAEEAVETLRWMRCTAELIADVGVAGPQRLQERRGEFADADAIVVVAGMEGALPSVVGGYVDRPVVAVPTSVGYGASFGGVAALLGMLNSCASNVTVVNIDSGFKGGYVAGLIARQTGKASEVSGQKPVVSGPKPDVR